ncbi:hypothetical protein SBOR_1608 [Sclerotinia borealis F-4128]|uniref:Uncharacterized protein n=1 Tax=Sclerotinia borealis (strain F-4128) TaxID=1432307 RepID=W9CU09_SCLBF|nr:hypothetical protein SBOR_1608 [Sclerotinia borealis F-4128]
MSELNLQPSRQDHGSNPISSGHNRKALILVQGGPVEREWSFPALSHSLKIDPRLPRPMGRCRYKVAIWKKFVVPDVPNDAHSGTCFIAHSEKCVRYNPRCGPKACCGESVNEPDNKEGFCLGENCPGLEMLVDGQKPEIPDVDFVMEYYYGHDIDQLETERKWLRIVRLQEKYGKTPFPAWKNADGENNPSFAEGTRELQGVVDPEEMPHTRQVMSHYPV